MNLGPELFARLNAEQRVGNQAPVIYGQGGLSEREISAIENQLGFPWPEDFRYLFRNVRDPGGVLFPWKNFEKAHYDERIAHILQGLEFDVEHANFWMRQWGEQPKELSAALEIARRDFQSWPRLLPIYGHRFLAAEPCRSSNPVFSIVQTDVVVYGTDLANYLKNEFLVRDDASYDAENPHGRHIDIWSDIANRGQSLLAWPSGLISAANAPWAKR